MRRRGPRPGTRRSSRRCSPASPLSGRFGFEISGRIDGPSAGALKTVALVALQNGDTIDKTVTMTGTINATGTIGPVGGIPEKLKGAAEEGLTKVLVPLGQRNSTNAAGEQVDLVREGGPARRRGRRGR